MIDFLSVGDGFQAFGGASCNLCHTQQCFYGLNANGDEIHRCKCGVLEEIIENKGGPTGLS